jgi:hypothetical protein
MTNPCIEPQFFDVTDGELSPLRQWQFQHRATAQGGGATFTPANNAAGTILFTVDVAWTNTTGITQSVYALMTQGPIRYSIDGLKHLVIRHQWGTSFGAAPPTPTLTEESRVRGLVDAGTGDVGPTVAVYILLEDRHPTATVPIGDVITLPAGQQVRARVQVSWKTDAWGLDWWIAAYGDPVPHRLGKVGPVRLDVFSTPVIT